MYELVTYYWLQEIFTCHLGNHLQEHNPIFTSLSQCDLQMVYLPVVDIPESLDAYKCKHK